MIRVGPAPRRGLNVEEVIVSTIYDGKQRKLFLQFCTFCGKSFYAPKHAGRRYCSPECFRASNPSKIHELKCDNCGLIFYRSQSNLKKSKSGLRFCSRICKDDAQRMGKHNEILRPSHYGDGRYSYRAIALRTYDKICNRCGYDLHPEILQVHHKDRDRTNNTIDNLELLCPNCHDLDHYNNRDGPYKWRHPE